MNERCDFSTLTMVLAILFLVFGCAEFESDDPGESPSGRRENSGPARVVLHAAELVAEFEGNEVRARQLYGGKRVQIYGTVNSISTLGSGEVSLQFRTSVSTYAAAQCIFSSSQSGTLTSVRGNEEVTAEGTVRGFDQSHFAVVLVDCRIP